MDPSAAGSSDPDTRSTGGDPPRSFGAWRTFRCLQGLALVLLAAPTACGNCKPEPESPWAPLVRLRSPGGALSIRTDDAQLLVPLTASHLALIGRGIQSEPLPADGMSASLGLAASAATDGSL